MVDWLTIILYVVLVVAGWFSICGASYEFDNVGLFDPSGRPGSQLMWMGLSVGLIFVLLMLESEFFDVFAYLIYAGFIVLLIATIFLPPCDTRSYCLGKSSDARRKARIPGRIHQAFFNCVKARTPD